MAQSCQYLNIPAWAVDQFADCDCRSAVARITQKELQEVTVGDFPKQSRLIFLPGGGTENYASLAAELASRYRWCGLSGKTLRSIRDPQSLFPIARDCGLRTPSTFFFSSIFPENNDKSSESTFDIEKFKPNRWLWKSSDRGGGLGVSDIETLDVLKYLLDTKAEGYLQEKIAGTPFGATLLISEDGESQWIGASRLLIAGDPLPNRLPLDDTSDKSTAELTPSTRRVDYPYLFGGAIGPIALPQHVIDRLLRFAQRCFENYGIKGWFQVDFILNSQFDLWLLEINPRWSATMEIYERILGRSLVQPHLQAWGVHAESHNFPPPIQKSLILKTVIYSPATFTWTEMESLKASTINARSMIELGWPIVADIPQVPTVFEEGMPILTLLIAGSQLSEIYQQTNHILHHLVPSPVLGRGLG